MMQAIFILVATVHTLYAHDFLSESNEFPASALAPHEMKVKVYREKKKIFMDAVFLSEGIKLETIRSVAGDIGEYDTNKIPGIIQAEKIADEIFWMHSETLTVHSRDYFLLTRYQGLDDPSAEGFSWTPIEKLPEWEFKDKTKFKDFRGTFYSKPVLRERASKELVYLRYALMFDLDSALPSFITKAVLNFKAHALAEGYIQAILRTAQIKEASLLEDH